MTAVADPAEVVRKLIAGMSDEAIHSGVDALVRGIIQGIADEVADRVVETILERIHAAAAVADPAPQPEPVAESQTPQDAVKRTCRLCGRVGTRRYVQTAQGWQCAPTAKCGDRPAQTAAPARATSTPKPTPAPSPPPPPPTVRVQPPPGPGVTAHCQDCTRTWNLTGRVLEIAVQTHELQRGHIVTVVGEVVPT